MIKQRSRMTHVATALLTVTLVLTLAPLFLMFYTSVRPSGTLKGWSRTVVIDDFDVGTTNDMGLASATEAEGAETQLQTRYDTTIRVGTEGRSLQFEYTVGPEGRAQWWTGINQDMRKFESLSFNFRRLRGSVDLELVLQDIDKQETVLPLKRYLSNPLSTEWQMVRIPMSDFKLSALTPALSDKIAERLGLRFPSSGASGGQIFVDEMALHFKNWTLDNFKDVLISGPFGRYFFNSFLIAIVVTAGNLIFSSMVGYAFARKEFPGKQAMFILILGSIMIPPQVMMVPMFILMKGLGWLNTYWALTIPALVGPFNIFLMRQYIAKLPAALEDAARIDGASDFQIFFRVVLPLTRPALAVVGINTFMGSWNTFLYPFLLTNTTEMRTLPVGLALYKSLHEVDWVHLMAGSTISALPVIIVFLLFQRHIIAGLTAGSTKG